MTTPKAKLAGRAPEAQLAEQERQFREMLEFCPAALVIVDEDGRLLFHNARLRELLGYQEGEIDLIDTRTFWHDLEQRSRIIKALQDRGGQLREAEHHSTSPRLLRFWTIRKDAQSTGCGWRRRKERAARARAAEGG